MPRPADAQTDRPQGRPLSQLLSERFGVDYSEIFPRLLEKLLVPSEMELLLATPGDTKSIATTLGWDELTVARVLYDLYMRGLAFITTHADGEPIWDVIDSGRFMDSILFDIRYDQYGNEFFEQWRAFFNQEMVHHEPSQESLRVLPIEEVIRSTRILDAESTRAIVRNSRRTAVQRCPCRVREKRCDNPLDVCISLDEFADYIVSRKLGKEISKQEALSIIEQCEDLGLVHQTVNSDEPDVICNCCPCCCSLLRSVIHHGIRTASAASRFRPVVAADLCVNCLACAGACHFSAMIDNRGQRGFVAANCFGCGLCAHMCPQSAIQLVEVHPPEHIVAGPSFNLSYLPPEPN